VFSGGPCSEVISGKIYWAGFFCDFQETAISNEVEKFRVRFEVFTGVTMKNGVFWDVTPCDSCKNRSFGGT
jgi:hypothetical protein